jgi:hypothetical protein
MGHCVNVRREKFNRTSGCEVQASSPAYGNAHKSRSSKPCIPTGDGSMKPGRAIVQAVMRKRERSRAPSNSMIRGGRVFIDRTQGSTRYSHTPVGILAPQGSETTACTKGSIWELGRSLRSRKRNFRVKRQGVMSKSITTLLKEFRCLHSSWEVR